MLRDVLASGKLSESIKQLATDEIATIFAGVEVGAPLVQYSPS